MRAGAAATGRRAFALAVRAPLGAVAADAHVAPHARAVARGVVEGVLAVLGRADLQTRPGALAHRVGDDRQQSAEDAVDAVGLGLQAHGVVGAEAGPQPGPV